MSWADGGHFEHLAIMSFRELWSYLQRESQSPARSGDPARLELPQATLEQAIAWCAAKATLTEPRSCLRGEPFGGRSTGRLDRSFVVDAVRWRTARASLQPPTSADGRLLAYFPDLNLCDGFAEVQSSGYLDRDNCPPWESWVALLVDPRADDYHRRVLVSWVPAVFVPLVAAGIEANPEECISWLQ
jgi:hypothetical protein